MSLDRFRSRITSVVVKAADGFEEAVRIKTLSYYEWQDIALSVPLPSREDYTKKTVQLVNGTKAESKDFQEQAYREALDEYIRATNMRRLGLALARGGDCPELVGMSDEQREDELLSWDRGIVNALWRALDELMNRASGESQSANFRQLSQRGPANLSEVGLDTPLLVTTE